MSAEYLVLWSYLVHTSNIVNEKSTMATQGSMFAIEAIVRDAYIMSKNMNQPQRDGFVLLWKGNVRRSRLALYQFSPMPFPGQAIVLRMTPAATRREVLCDDFQYSSCDQYILTCCFYIQCPNLRTRILLFMCKCTGVCPVRCLHYFTITFPLNTETVILNKAYPFKEINI